MYSCSKYQYWASGQPGWAPAACAAWFYTAAAVRVIGAFAMCPVDKPAGPAVTMVITTAAAAAGAATAAPMSTLARIPIREATAPSAGEIVTLRRRG